MGIFAARGDMESKKVLLFGLGFFQRTLLRMLIENRPCIVVDIDKDLAERAQNEYADVTAVEGEASSIVTWKKINIEDISHIVSSLQDYDVVLEICRIARNVYKLQIPIILMLYKNDRREELEQYDVKIINPLLIAAESVLNIIQKNYAKPNNIGLGKGEIVEVMIRRRSHMVDRKMRFLAPNRWRVAAAYRDGHLIVPDGDFKLQIGDKAVLVGDPKVVENIVNILMIGKPEFPLQYGQTLAVLADKIQADDELEMNYFHGNTKAKKYLWYDTEKSSTRTKPFTENLEKEGCVFGGTLQNFRSAAYLHDTGTLAVSGSAGFGLFNRKLKYYFKKARHPVLICRGKFPYSQVVISLNGNIPDILIETGAEIAAHFNIPCKCIFVSPPGALKTSEDEENLKARLNFIRDYENLTSTKVPFTALEGNPVHKTLSEIMDKPACLLVVAANSKDPISFFNPHPSFLITSYCDNSVLILPDEDINER